MPRKSPGGSCDRRVLLAALPFVWLLIAHLCHTSSAPPNSGRDKMVMYAIGNQAGDADSIVSALAAAHLLKHGFGLEVSAVISFPRKEFRLRGDAIELFKLAGYANEDGYPRDVLFLDDVKEIQEVVLTDANVVGPHISSFKPKVVAVFDHHKDEGLHKDASPRLVCESTGSACSVVAEQIFANDEASKTLSKSLLILMYGTILMDTRNFGGGRHDTKDVKVFAEILKRLPEEFMQEKDLIFKKLIDARHDVSHLSVGELLRLDYKQVDEHGEHVGFSTVFSSAKQLFKPERHIEDAMLEMMDEKQLSALVAITAVEKDSERRGLVLCSSSESLSTSIISGLSAPPKDVFSVPFLALPLAISQRIVERGFGLEPASLGTSAPIKMPRINYHFSIWKVHGTVTRKTLLPAVMELIERVKRI